MKITNNYNLIIDVDSYKDEHGRMLKDGIEFLQSSIIARKCNSEVYTNKVIPFGYIYFIKEYLSKPITMENIDEAEMFFNMHGASVEFNRKRWEYIVKEHNGFLPLKINAVKEGTIFPIGMPILRVENTDPQCAWLVSYIETALLRATWYGTTVATNSFIIKKMLKETMEKHSPLGNVDFHLHNFGARGGTSYESEKISSMAHLISFSGTDSMLANRSINYYYPSKNKEIKPFGFSVIASEHSVSCSQANYEERDDFPIAEKMLNILEEELDKKEKLGIKNNIPTIVSIVIDTYDAYRFTSQYIGERLKEKIIKLGKRGGKIVLRPDSGDPLTMPIEIIKILMDKFGYKINANGYKCLPDFLGVLQGDGVNAKSIQDILSNLEKEKISLTNIVFGMGGKLVVPSKGRDTYSFAMKATAQKLKNDNNWQHLIKDPITDIGKRSLSGHISTYIEKGDNKGLSKNHILVSEIERMCKNNYWEDMLVEVFNNGEIIHDNINDFDEIRNLAKI